MTDIEKTPEEEKELIMRIIQYVKKHHRVTLSQITSELKLDQTDHNYMLMALVKKRGSHENPNHIIAYANRPFSNQEGDYKEDEYQLLPTAIFSYIDYLEIRVARKHAEEATQLAIMSINLAFWTLILSAVLGLFGVVVQILLTK